MKRYIDSLQTPEARAEFAVGQVLAAFRTLPRLTDEEREENRKLVGEHTAMMHQFYGMSDAARDLAIKPRSGETMEMSVGVELIELKTSNKSGE